MKNNFIKIFIMVLLIFAAPAFIFTGCSDDNEEVSGKEKVYYCPMHPEVQSDKPGVCPICHMDLVLKDNGGDDRAEHTDDLLQLNNRKLALANISVTEVKSEELSRQIDAYSYIDFAEQNRVIITAKFSGRIEKLFVNRTGDYIRKGEALFEIYSPDLIQAQNDYLIASKGFGNLSTPGQGAETNTILDAAKQKLLYMGITSAQINDLEKSGKINSSIKYYSPASGTVIEKKVQEGMYVNEGTIIYDIADLSELWVLSEIFSDDIGLIKKGDEVKFNLQAYPGKQFSGRVDLIYPVVNPESRTVKIRSVFQNNENLLKPNMYGNAVFSIEMKKGLFIPAEAVILTGERSIVWVEKEKGKFELREIKIGHKLEGKYQVISGLAEGEKVASEGSYLIDSESQLRSGLSTGHQQHQPANENNKPAQGKHQNHSQIMEDGKIFNEVCPVLGNKIPADAVTVVYKGMKIGFCCPGCDKEFLADPEKYMKNLSDDGKNFIKNI